MEETIYGKQRREGYEKVLQEIKENKAGRTLEENAIKEKIFRWWAEWKPDYEGWLVCADSLYAPGCMIDAIGDKPQVYKNYRLAMKHQRDTFIMDMGPIDKCVVEGDTLAISYNMCLTAKETMGPLEKGMTYKIKVTEFNRFSFVNGKDKDPMVVELLLTSTTPGV